MFIGLLGTRLGRTIDRGLRIELLAILKDMGRTPRLKFTPEEKRPWAIPRVSLKGGQELLLMPAVLVAKVTLR